MHIKWILYLSGFCCSAWAQNIIEEKQDTITAHLGLKQTLLNVEFQHKDRLGPQLKYQANLTPFTYVSVSYGRLSGSLGLTRQGDEFDSKTHGSSRVTDYQLRFHGRVWSPEFYYQSYQGYYLENTNQVGLGSGSGETRYFRPDLKAEHWGAQVYYNFYPDQYSFSSPFSLKSRQLESAGTWFLVGSRQQYSLSGDTSFIPASVAGYGEIAQVNSMKMSTTALGGAGAYNFVFGRYFVGGLFGFALNYQQIEMTDLQNKTETYDEIGTKTYLKLATGFNSEQFHIGASLSVDSLNMSIDRSQVIFDTMEGKLFIGWRFDESKIVWLDQIDREVANVMTAIGVESP